MNSPKKRVNPLIEKHVEAIFCQLIVDLKSPHEAGLVFGDLLTAAEKKTIYNRIAIALFLDKGRTHENIKAHLKVSSASIDWVRRYMGTPGIVLSLQKIKAERWASDWTRTISGWVAKTFPKK